jgi:hypothetical protein
MSSHHLATRFTCSWPWSTLVLLCDGRLVCGCADPYGKRVLGDARQGTVSSVWQGERTARLRDDLNHGGSEFCGDCPLKLPLGPDDPPPVRPLPDTPLPTRLYIECTAACNISCFEACCAPETGITRTRQAGMLDFDLFRRVVDEAGPSLVRIDFFNYGEAFLHKRAIEMCEYVKTAFPHVYLYTSTNGLAFAGDSVRRLVRSGIDEVTFSIDGATPATYARYRQRGSFERAIAALGAAADEKRAARRDVPFLNWRYILFRWNDSDQEMQLARRMAADLGVDRLCWEITDHPESAFSRRFLPGSPAWQEVRHEVWEENGLGNAIRGATPRARILPRDWAAGETRTVRRNVPVRTPLRVRNLSQRAFAATASYGRRLVRVGAQLASGEGRPLDRDFARAALPQTLAPGEWVDVDFECTAPGQPGDYQIRFDLVCEGIDWFERCGSEVSVRRLLVE